MQLDLINLDLDLSPSLAPTIPERIRAVRAKLGVTQSDLARMFGVTHPAVSHWECGRAGMSGMAVKILEQIEAANGIGAANGI